MKAYTNLEQSRKLAEILPLESADMNYWCGTQIRIGGHKTMDKDLDVPCWSVGALIEVMHQSVIDKDGISFGLIINHDFVEYYNPSMGALYATYHSVSAETTLDACYDMVVWLFENGYIKKGD